MKTTTSSEKPASASYRPRNVELLTEDEVESRKRLEALAWLFDQSIKIPFINFRIGLDSIVGLFPGVGDLISAAVSTYLVSEASRLGASKVTLLRMAGHILIDTVLGAVPVVGDLFDATYKANSKNVKLLNEHLNTPQTVRKKNTFLVVAIGIVLFGGAIASMTLLVLLITWIASLV